MIDNRIKSRSAVCLNSEWATGNPKPTSFSEAWMLHYAHSRKMPVQVVITAGKDCSCTGETKFPQLALPLRVICCH
jgi:hypothetical protein